MKHPAHKVCWSCKGPVEASALFCDTCNAIQAPGQLDHFKRFGLERSFVVDIDAVEATYLKQQQKLHPDRFASKSPREQALSSQQAASLNEAFETLKNPVARAHYMLRLAGVEPEGGGGHTVNDPELLMEAMEMREALDDADNRMTVDAMIKDTRKQARACENDLADAFAKDAFDTAKKLTTRLRYLMKMTEEARAKKSRLAAA
ncbi:MAG TPA: Fe-S protein assembly co-chaperone HscB [Thalassospira lucentensis]|uniref:Co-chaperone protein HscB homolog n=2 Tax=Thalassospira lucentensis TaxID=168935 RepID=A0A358HR65_9PROT|nr:Fe-S protein assembly co-chaperone HscB [Thalassospira lucentensis]HCW67155.1 Fe-S protein assembly co-chaperone HscB [Thalassospira lucentensis]|tara:strand:- start:690 stop:1301 length:612 start_codon:yes stop_codon:yes gene_type:complete